MPDQWDNTPDFTVHFDESRIRRGCRIWASFYAGISIGPDGDWHCCRIDLETEDGGIERLSTLDPFWTLLARYVNHGEGQDDVRAHCEDHDIRILEAA